ncbi:hypothetical protein GF322_03310 [Candidatus Dependentiae bacterium]|nr:hypothetical protein [Candidatus Dependentiae bacterium]
MKKNIPFFSIERQYTQNKKTFLKALTNVLDSQNFIGGTFVQKFETNFSSYVKSKYAISCNSGTDALWLALKALNLQKNSIVLTTPFSFIASSSEIVAHKAHPVFIDIDETTFNIDPQKIEIWIKKEAEFINSQEKLIHKKTGFPVAGILFVDIFGQCTNYKAIKEISNKYNLWLIEDACQAVGAQTNDGKSAGTLANISCFSFYPTKNLGAFGDGGCCTTNNKYLAEQMIQLRNHGRKSHYNYIQHGINSRLDGIQAAILDKKLKLLDHFNDQRINIAQTYNQQLKGIDFIKTPKTINGKHVYHQYCIQLTNQILRDQLIQELSNHKINTNIYYPKTLDQIDFLNTHPQLKNVCPIAQNLTKTTLALPIWPELEKEEVEYICQKIKEVAQKLQISTVYFQKTNSCKGKINE